MYNLHKDLSLTKCQRSWHKMSTGDLKGCVNTSRSQDLHHIWSPSVSKDSMVFVYNLISGSKVEVTWHININRQGFIKHIKFYYMKKFYYRQKLLPRQCFTNQTNEGCHKLSVQNQRTGFDQMTLHCNAM